MTEAAYGLATEPFDAAPDAVAALCFTDTTWVPHDKEATWWLFASGPGGYVTGVLDEGKWYLTNQDHQQVTGLPAAEHLSEIRIFKPGTEIRLFPVDATWRGTVREPAPAAAPPAWLKPRRQTYLMGRADSTSKSKHEHASVVRDRNNGQDVVVPVTVSDGNNVKVTVQEYFGVDDATGAVRVVAACWQGFSLDPSSIPEKEQ